MSKPHKLSPRLPRGFADQTRDDLAALDQMAAAIKGVYRAYGFEHVETPLLEYTDALGKYLPDQDRPNEGVFSFQDDDEQWLSLRYDLTAPLARYVAENFDRLPKPFRSYRYGHVFRNEKPGPGRFRQFVQFDADTVGSSSPAADAEMCMMMADTMEALGLKRGEYAVKVSSRKLLDGLLETLGLQGEGNAAKRLLVLRAIDKWERLGQHGVEALLGAGRKDESGDFTKGAGLAREQIERVLMIAGQPPAFSSETEWEDQHIDDEDVIDILVEPRSGAQNRLFVMNKWTINHLREELRDSATAQQGLDDLQAVNDLCLAAGYRASRIRIEPSIVRGLEYYTGVVYETELEFPVTNERGEKVVFGSVAGGGRYDGLVAKFRGEEIPATGFSIGVSRLLSALKVRGLVETAQARGPVVVCVMERERLADYTKLAQTLRAADIPAEVYLGSGGLKAQFKYADKRGSPCVVIQGPDERAKGEVQIKDLVLGAEMAASIADNKEWRESRPAQVTVVEEKLAENVRQIIKREP